MNGLPQTAGKAGRSASLIAKPNAGMPRLSGGTAVFDAAAAASCAAFIGAAYAKDGVETGRAVGRLIAAPEEN